MIMVQSSHGPKTALLWSWCKLLPAYSIFCHRCDRLNRLKDIQLTQNLFIAGFHYLPQRCFYLFLSLFKMISNQTPHSAHSSTKWDHWEPEPDTKDTCGKWIFSQSEHVKKVWHACPPVHKLRLNDMKAAECFSGIKGTLAVLDAACVNGWLFSN